MPIRYPAPLRPGDRIGVTSPSSGVPDALWGRFTYAVSTLRDRGFDVVVGELNHAPSHVSGPREARAAELMAMLLDPTIRAVVPPWGGETCIDLLDLLDLDAVAAAEPTWCVGFSDTSTCIQTAGVGWYVPDDVLLSNDQTRDVTMTAVGYRPRVRVFLPGEYRPDGFPNTAASIGAVVDRDLELVKPCK